MISRLKADRFKEKPPQYRLNKVNKTKKNTKTCFIT